MRNIPSVDILGVKVDKIAINEATDLVHKWLRGKDKHYIVTTNIEFIMAAQKDKEFKKVLNKADLSISDSSRLNWAYKISREKNLSKRLTLWPFFLAPNLLQKEFSVVTGVDLMNELCRLSADQAFKVGLLGGEEGVAEKTAECLKKMYPNIKISFAKSGGRVNEEGQGEASLDLPPCDIIFVAFGHIKQEKWIYENLNSVRSKVFIGVGGTFDYLSGRVPRAPQTLRSLGLEWLFRGIVQPWRIKRFFSLLQFIFLIMVC